MNKFLETYNLPRLDLEEIKILNRSVTTDKTESVIKNLPTRKNIEQHGSNDDLYQYLKNKSIYLKQFQKTEEEGALPNYQKQNKIKSNKCCCRTWNSRTLDGNAKWQSCYGKQYGQFSKISK